MHVGLVTYGIHWSTPFSSALILACGPVFTLLILRWYGIEHLTRGQVAGVGVACLGVLVFLSDKLFGGLWRAGGGDLVLLIAASLFSYYTVMAKPMIERYGSVTVMSYATLMGSAPVVLLNLPAGLQVDWASISPAIWAGMFYAVLISAFLGWMVWGWVNAVRGVARSAPLMYLMPPVAGLVAWVLTGERYTAIKLAGAAVTLAGVALAQFAVRATPCAKRSHRWIQCARAHPASGCRLPRIDLSCALSGASRRQSSLAWTPADLRICTSTNANRLTKDRRLNFAPCC